MCSLPEDDKRDLAHEEVSGMEEKRTVKKRSELSDLHSESEMTVENQADSNDKKDSAEELSLRQRTKNGSPKIWLFTAAFVVLIDQISKLLAKRFLEPTGDFPIINGILHLTYVENTGAAFGIFKDHRWVFMSISCAAVAALIVYLIVSRNSIGMLGGVSLSMIIGGGIGNMIDRVLSGFVIDFINFELINFAVFNIADSAVCIGAVLLIVYVLFLDKRNALENAGK